MLRVNRVINQARASISTCQFLLNLNHEQKICPLPSQHFGRNSSNRFFDIYKLASKKEIEKERARLADELNRGYFDDLSELKQHGGKIATANKILIPAIAAKKFPAVDVIYSDGRESKLPVTFDGNGGDASKLAAPKACLVCLSFRANSQAWISFSIKPFYEAFSESKNVRLYEVSFIDSWLLCLNPIKQLLLRFMRKSSNGEDTLQRHIVYSFGDHYYFRKELKILTLLTGYIFLLDKFGRVRWQGFGLAKQEELSSLLSCTTVLLEEK
ncbi:vacuolar protein sorting-associated protein 41-like protein [Hibiscus syriacus]|uniref:Vacuolar protein sorting-associated protein 41-like protein n=1 Tax=Hibiscus syriacus TaxID=106335 RepID=A0A6A3B305_HIBSY|nr:vacuolar protein sorting-associated protein 41-like protein [Hibiscus syriacus]